MKWYVLQVMTGSERDVCTALRRKGVQARAPAQRMEIRRRGQWQTEERLLLPGYVFVGAEYSAALFHVVSPVSGVIRWLGLHCGEPQALDTQVRCGGGWTARKRWNPAGCCFVRTAHGMCWAGRWRLLQAARYGWSGGSAGRM